MPSRHTKERLFELMMKVNPDIKEEIEEIIISEEEYNPDDIVDFNKIDLRKEFNRLNELLFNGEVPKVPLKWSKRKKALGHVRSRIDKRERKIYSVELWISTFFSVTYKTFLNTLAHEMIHVLINSRNPMNAYDPHGRDFMEEANRINSMGFGFEITKTNGENLKISKQTRERIGGRRFVVLVLEINGTYSIAVTTPQVYNRDHHELFNMLQNIVNKGKYKDIEINVIESTNPELMKLPQARTLASRIRSFSVGDDLLEELLDDKIVRTIVMTKNNREDTKDGESGIVAEEIETILIS